VRWRGARGGGGPACICLRTRFVVSKATHQRACVHKGRDGGVTSCVCTSLRGRGRPRAPSPSPARERAALRLEAPAALRTHRQRGYGGGVGTAAVAVLDLVQPPAQPV